MVYRVIGIMSGSSLDGLDIVYTGLTETGGKWEYEIIAATCYAYQDEWKKKLQEATKLSALEYQLLHAEYGHYIGQKVNAFIFDYQLQHKVHLVASHGHTSFHMPAKKMTAQLGDGAAIAAVTKLPVVSDLRSLDVAFGGQGAPIVPIGEQLLFRDFDQFLNIGGIANLSFVQNEKYVAFDVCPANRVLNMLSEEKGLPYDAAGKIAASGKANEVLLHELNALEYYQQPFPKSLANNFGTDLIYPIIKKAGINVEDALRTYVEHICQQIMFALKEKAAGEKEATKLLVTGGGALNDFLIERLSVTLMQQGIKTIVPDLMMVQYKEALIMALIGVLRWREEANVLSSVTGSAQDSIGGALWLGTEA